LEAGTILKKNTTVSTLFAVAVGGGVTTMVVTVPLNNPCQIPLFDIWPATVNKLHLCALKVLYRSVLQQVRSAVSLLLGNNHRRRRIITRNAPKNEDL